MIKEMQKNAAFMDPTRAAAHLVGAQASAMQAAAGNQGAGPAMAFMGMSMAGAAGGVNAQSLYQMGAQQQAVQPAAPANGWTCTCGQGGITGNFCPNCGSKKPEPKPAADAWTCPGCGASVTGKFCPECGAKKPEAAADGVWTFSCGAVNSGKFCAECGKPKPAVIKRYKCNKCGWVPADPTKPPKFCPECGDPFDTGDAV